MFSNCFDDQTSIFSEEEETPAFAAVIVFLSSVCFENLVAVAAGI